MKFNDVNKIQQKKTQVTKSKSKTGSKLSQANIIDYTLRFGNLGVYIMKNGKKGLFQEISTYINDGELPTSWALKISYNDGWFMHFGVNANADFTRNDLFLTELFAIFMDKFPNIEISGNRKMVLITNLKDRHEVESIGNYIVNMFRDIELDFVEKVIHTKFTLQDSHKPLRIIGFYSENKKTTNSKKYLVIQDHLSKINMSNEDAIVFNKITQKLNEEKELREKDKKALNTLMKSYLNNNERISIAMQYIQGEE